MFPPLPKRILGRTDRPVPPVLWEVSAGHVGSGRLIETLKFCESAGADWFLIPSSIETKDIALLVEQLKGIPTADVILGVDAIDLVARTRRAELERLDALRPIKCSGIMIQSATPSELKSGGPFHRLNMLRQQGRCDLVLADAQTVADGEWIVGSSPAHAVAVPFGIEDQSAGFRVLNSAEEMGTSILARRPVLPAWKIETPMREADLSFVISHPDVTMVIEPLPMEVDAVIRMLTALSHPLHESERQRWWDQFAANVAEPPKPKGNHPPEYGA